MNLPNKLTLLRICLVPFMAVFFFINYDWCMWAAAAIFIVAAITDIIDGNYARKHDICTDFGRLMDPIADKILTNTAFILVISCGRFQFSELERMILAICVIIFIAREFVISGFRLVAAGKGLVMAAGKLGKAKTTLQCIAAVSLRLDADLRLSDCWFDLFPGQRKCVRIRGGAALKPESIIPDCVNGTQS